MVVLVPAGCMLVALAGAIIFGLRQEWPIAWRQVAINGVIIVAVLASIGTAFDSLVIVLASGCWLAFVASPTMLRQSPGDIHTRSPMVDAVAARLPDHARFVIAAPGTQVLPPNFNALFGLASVHSYDSLSSRRYQAFIRTLGGDTSVFGRWNDAVSPDYAGAAFWMSNVALVISPVALAAPSLACHAGPGSLWLCDVNQRMGRTRQVEWDKLPGAPAGVDVGDPRALPYRPSRVARDDGDRVDVDVSPGPPSMLILSQQYHSDWHAMAMVGGRRTAARTLPVNGFFQGVIIPANADKITMSFRPWARYAYLANYVWVLLFAALALKAGLSRRPSLDHAYE
jgi:hypothetical protein